MANNITKDSNLIGIETIINTDNLKGNLNEISKIEGSIAAPSEYTALHDELFGDDNSIAETYISSKLETSYASTNDYGSDEEDNSDDLSDSEQSIKRKKIVVNTSKKQFHNVVDIDTPVVEVKDKTHIQLVEKIDVYEKNLKDRKIPVPHYKKDRIKKDLSYANEVMKLLRNASDDNTFALSISSFIDLALKILCSFFDGRHQILGFKIDLTGYDNAVRSDFNTMYSDSVEFAGVFRRKFGRKGMVGFSIFKTFGVNLGLTLYKNNSGFNNPNILSSNNFADEDVEEEEYEEEEDEE